MDNIIDIIVRNNTSLFGQEPTIEKINVGFTNTLYKINDLFIVKVCTDLSNEDEFKREIDFYNSNKENSLIPQLYYANIEKKDIPYFYEILEKIKGVSLYSVWHTYSEEQREDIIRQLCGAMKQMHNIKGEEYDWSDYMKKSFNPLYEKAQRLIKY